MNFQKSYIILTLILFTVTAFAKSIQVTNITVDSSNNHISTFSKPILKVSENKNDNGVNSIHSESASILSNLTYNFNKAKPNCNYKNYEVGAINESCQINPNGSSSVNVKIELPTNPYLFQPTLSLCYNSMSMASDLGWGWNIVGSSCITKTNKSIYFDGTTESSCIRNDSLSAFSIDGTRLMKTYETNGINEKNKYYFGNKYEIVDASDGITERLFLAGDAYNSPAVLVISQDNAQLYQIARDYQGSIKAIFDSTGNLVEELTHIAARSRSSC